jgi:hypothetical protein
MRVQWVEAEQEIEKLNLGYFEITQLRDLAEKFYICCSLRNDNERERTPLC